MERIEHRDCVLELVVDGVLVPVERIQRRDLHLCYVRGPEGIIVMLAEQIG